MILKCYTKLAKHPVLYTYMCVLCQCVCVKITLGFHKTGEFL